MTDTHNQRADLAELIAELQAERFHPKQSPPLHEKDDTTTKTRRRRQLLAATHPQAAA